MSEKKQNIITVICLLIIIFSAAAFLLLFIGNGDEEFSYRDNLDKKVLTVASKDDDSQTVTISMQEMSYYIINIEGDMNDMATQYDSENPNSYWNIILEKGMYTMRDYAKDLTMDSCVRDNIYYLEAMQSGMKLTDEECKKASDNAKLILDNLTGRQMDISNYDYNDLYNIQLKVELAGKYANNLLENGYTKEELEISGEYYDELKEKYDIVIEDIWDNVSLGELSIKTKKD